jgi:NADH-quinone oxidoreductase E subunit
MLTEDAKTKIDDLLTKYPTKKAALIPSLWLMQSENDGWLPRAAMHDVAAYLELAPAYVEGVATFYTMFNKAPIGKYHLEVCHNIVCMARGADALIDHIGEKLGIGKGDTTPDKQFTLNGAECLGACANAPCMMVGDVYFEDIDNAKADQILEDLARK